MRRPARTLAAAVLALGLAAGCEGGDVTPTDVGEPTPVEPTPGEDPGVRDPGDDLDEPDPADPDPTGQPGIVTPAPTPED